MGVGVKIADGEALHMGEKLCAQVAQRPLRHIDHHTVEGKGTYHPDEVHAGNLHQGCAERGKIRISGADQRRNIIVNQGLKEQGPAHLSKRRDNDAHHHDNTVRRIVFEDYSHQAL